jgi:hypothetical protein
MSRTAPGALEESPPAARRGRFVAAFRNRPIGEEKVEWGSTPSGGLRLQAETTLALDRVRLFQKVAAEFDAAARPERCRISARHGSREYEIDVEIAGSRVHVRAAGDLDSGSRLEEVDHEPLLLVDNCFSLHALAALVASRGETAGRRFSSVPAFQELGVTAPGLAPVLLGGERFEPPTLTLHLTDSLNEHVWISRGRVERLIVPEIQIQVDWIPDRPGEGGHR